MLEDILVTPDNILQINTVLLQVLYMDNTVKGRPGRIPHYYILWGTKKKPQDASSHDHYVRTTSLYYQNSLNVYKKYLLSKSEMVEEG